MSIKTQNSTNTTDYRLILATEEGTYYFLPEQIVRMKSSSNYTSIYFTHRKPMLAAKVLKEFEVELMPFGFLRTHKSHLVNKNYIACIAQRGNIVMSDASVAELSRRKKPEALRSLKNK